MIETPYNHSINQEILDIHSPDFLDDFKEAFAKKMESIYREHPNAVSPETKISIPLKIREGENLGDVNSWAGDAFASLLQFCPGLGDKERDNLKNIFFKNTENI